ncbi:TPA: polysaccharide pyruvyl transferase family protein [Providencia alcalifaciens]|uniref:Putative polysaccharide pyruvyl transferase n=1 Tax=Providencia alcalifaciens TaxID=126385 RepID=A0A346CLD7_9GAMM|nr:putative polysaccharide pyruvyl transferase [Providencia alcalifaciens]MTC34469.1 hypothetical protein [Providencia alcalifaciens]
MKIATLTLPFHPNYGAVLQAFALQKALQSLGHETYSLNIMRSSLRSFPRNILSSLKRILTTGEFRENYKYGNKLFYEFINKELNLSNKIKYQRDFYRKDIQSFDAYIVGSDQVWRPSYVIDINKFFLNFVPTNKIKISYAASFGTDKNEYTENNIISCKNAIKQFKAVSVREKNGVQKCKDLFDTSSTEVLDPTFLLEKNDYAELIKKYPNSIGTKKIVCYLLDATSQKRDLINKTFFGAYYINDGTSDYDKISIPDWLKLIQNAETVITDSFHGVVFSIIFQKKFIAIGNTARGLERFSSLLTKLSLSDHLVIDSDLTMNNLLQLSQIVPNYSETERLLEKYKKISYSFIESNIINNH